MDRQADELQAPKDLSHLFSKTTKAREASSVKQFYKYFAIPGIAQLAGGLPNNKYFPYDTLESRVALPERWTPSEKQPEALSYPHSKVSTQPDSHLLVPHTELTADLARKIDLDTALQYGTAQGYTPLLTFIKEFATKHLHPTIPYKDGANVILTCGNTDGMSKALQCFNNEWHEGDPVDEREGLLVEKFAYMNAIQQSRPRGMNIVPVELDDQGMMAEGKGGLKEVLDGWDFSRGKIPHIMYTVTVGQNPTSGVLSVERRKAVYALCQQYDIIIIEDDPYWYLQFPSGSLPKVPTPKKSSGFEFLDSLMPSYLSIDTDGRVVRLDTFSKMVAPGCRLGWITAQPAIVERLLRITESSTAQPSGFVQSMIAELLVGPSKGGSGSGGSKNGTGWDMSGWVRWLEGLRGEYERRMTTMCDGLDAARDKIKLGHHRRAAEDDWVIVKKTPIIDFVRPAGGMFLWLRLNLEAHPLFGKIQGARLSLAIWTFWTTAPYKILVAPGGMFSPNSEILAEDAWKYVRICFSALPSEDLEDVTKRMVAGLSAFWNIRDVKVIDDLLRDLDNTEYAMKTENITDMSSTIGFC